MKKKNAVEQNSLLTINQNHIEGYSRRDFNLLHKKRF